MAQDILDEQGNLIDEIIDFPGLWGMPSKCGLKVVHARNQDIVIITDLYEDNPGTSVTSYCAGLANYIAESKALDKRNICFIQHNPDVGSKYAFLQETFDEVSFTLTENGLKDPVWKRVPREYVEKMIDSV